MFAVTPEVAQAAMQERLPDPNSLRVQQLRRQGRLPHASRGNWLRRSAAIVVALLSR